MTRTTKGLALAIVTAVVVVFQVAAPANACACGAPAPVPGTEVNVNQETAIVRWDGDREEIVMQLDMISDAGETGLVVPTPTPATVTAGDAEAFDDILREIEPREEIEYDWWGPNPFTSGMTGAPAGSAPEVLDRVQLGPIEATTLASSDAEGLMVWLDENGYALSPAVAEELSPYVADGWSFVALKLTGELPFDGELDPIRFTFDSESLVYPMRMSRAADSEQNVRLYVFDDHRSTVSGTDGDLAIAPSVYWAAPVSDSGLSELGAFLTVVDLSWADPSAQISGDLAIEQASSDDTVIPTYTTVEIVTVAGIPVGPLVIFLLVLALAVSVVVVVVVRRSRRT